MLVYGDATWSVGPEWVAKILREQLTRAVSDIEQLRVCLVMAGQLEQGLADANDEPDSRWAGHILRHAEQATAHVARALYVVWARITPGAPDSFISPREACAAAIEELAHIRGPCPTAPIRIPEGFAYYSLLPEHYFASALQCVPPGERSAGRILAMGIRSIGTTLSACVEAALRAAGIAVCRCTVRPTGHPFSRRTHAESVRLDGITRVLIVDEGPGLSGSSMASVAIALRSKGIHFDRIAFLPAHDRLPGPQASSEIRDLWNRIPRFPASAAAGPDPVAHLRKSTDQHLGADDRVNGIANVGGGNWRQYIQVDRHPPAAYAAFERSKFLCTTERGPQILWKFEGVAPLADLRSGAEHAWDSLDRAAAAGWGPRPLAITSGYVAREWLPGRLSSRDTGLDDAQLDRLGCYIGWSAQTPSAESRAAQFERLVEMSYWNTCELIDETAAECLRDQLRNTMDVTSLESLPSYGDGRLSPADWILTESGEFMRTSPGVHWWDHTTVGEQPILWDLAGASVEWNLDTRRTRQLLEAYRAACGVHFDFDLLHAYRSAYAAFRAGWCVQNLGAVDADNDARLIADRNHYTNVLRASIAAATPSSDGHCREQRCEGAVPHKDLL